MTPQIKVTFEVDANGILNVKAEDKASGKSENITFTNEKGRLSQEEIEHMVMEAEEFVEEDKKVKEKIDTRNALDTYVYNMKNQVNDRDKLADKLEEDEKEKIETATAPRLKELQGKISSIGASLIKKYSVKCTHALLDDNVSLNADVVDVIMFKRHIVSYKWIKRNVLPSMYDQKEEDPALSFRTSIFAAEIRQSNSASHKGGHDRSCWSCDGPS
nr:luminal-binding protein 5-like [Tanacetum cinerariifolium]